MNSPTMDHQIRRLLQIVSITVLLGTGYSNPCSFEVVEECTKELLQGGYDLTITIVPVYDETGLAKRCQAYALFEECMKDLRFNCEEIDHLVFKGIEDSHAWLCVEGKEQYLRHQGCFADTDLQSDLRACFGTYEYKIDSLVASSSSLRRLCQYANEYLDCVDREVTSFCGAEAGMWLRTFKQKAIEPITDSINCAIDNGRRTTRPFDNGQSTTDDDGYAKIIIPVVVCIIPFFLTVYVAVMVKKHKKKSQTTETHVHGTSASDHDTVADIAGLEMSSTASRREPYLQPDIGTSSFDVANDMLTPEYPEACGYNVIADKESSAQIYSKSEVPVHPAIKSREIGLPDCRATHVYGHPVGLSTESSPSEYAESNPPAYSELGVSVHRVNQEQLPSYNDAVYMVYGKDMN